MRLETLNLLLDRLQIVRYSLQPTAAALALAGTALEVLELLALVVEQLLELALDEGGLAVALTALLALDVGLDAGHLLVQLLQLLLEADLLPVVRLGRGEVGSAGLEAAAAQAGEVLVAKLGLAARRR